MTGALVLALLGGIVFLLVKISSRSPAPVARPNTHREPPRVNATKPTPAKDATPEKPPTAVKAPAPEKPPAAARASTPEKSSTPSPSRRFAVDRAAPTENPQAKRSDTQFSGHVDDDARPLDVVFGLDFGTSSTKIVIQTPAIARGRAVPVPFGEYGHSTSDHLLPTTLYRDPDGEYSLRESPGADKFDRLKLELMEKEPDRAAVEHAAAYMALAIRLGRSWFLDTQRREIGRRKLRWQLNVGVPSPGYGDKSMLRVLVLQAFVWVDWRESG